MRSNRLAVLMVVFALLGAMLSCNMPGSVPPVPSEEEVATVVAETMAVQEEKVITEPVQQQSATPEPAPTELPKILKLVYTDASRDLWRWVEGDTVVKLVDTGDVVDAQLSGDGTMVAFVRSSDYLHFSLWVVDFAGGDLRELVSESEFAGMKNNADAVGVEPYVYQWFPEEKALAFVTSPTFEGPGLFVNDDLWRVDAVNGDLRRLLAPGEGGVFYFSPEGDQIALVTPSSINVVDKNGQNRRELFQYDPVLTYSEFRYYAAPKWNPDGKALRVSIPPVDALGDEEGPTLNWQIAVDGSGVNLLSEIYTVPLGSVDISPDRSRMAYFKEVGEPSENLRELHIAKLDGSEDTIYHTARQMNFGGWAPDSKRFAFSFGKSEDAQLGEVGMGFFPLTNVGGEKGINWVDEDTFIFLAVKNGKWGIYIGQPGGLGTLIDVPGNSDSFFPTYSFYY